VKFVVERNEFEIRIGYCFIHSSFLLFFFLKGDFAQRLVISEVCRSDSEGNLGEQSEPFIRC